MDLIGKSPISLFGLITAKLAVAGCILFFFLKTYFIDTMLYDSAVSRFTGILFFAGGVLMVIVSLVHLGRSAAVGIPERDTELRTRGMYRFTRNPIYLGGFAICAGSCLYAIHPLNFFCFAIAAFLHHRIVLQEEKFLQKRFGNPWVEYAQRVPRYFGIIRRSGESR